MVEHVAPGASRVVVLGTGGTIAGRAAAGPDNIGYTAAQIGVAELLAGIGAPDGVTVTAEQVAQVDSKDMSLDIWRALALRCAHWLARSDVAGVVITHGTDTLEESAFFLQSVLAPARPVVLTCAMRPATALSPDGPQNLRDALAVALTLGAQGVTVVCAGRVHSAIDVRKSHTYRLDAFDSGDAGPIGYVEEGVVRCMRNWPATHEARAQVAMNSIADDPFWPRVEIVTSHAGAQATLVDLLVQARVVDGLVLAATGNGSLHRELEAAALRAQDSGVAVLCATRCARGRILPRPHQRLRDAGALSPVKARIALMLELLVHAPGTQ